ncbi:class I SAM-dependent methyltransferase [Aquimarina rhabdastrellae]
MSEVNKNSIWHQKWNERYKQSSFAYGKQPNVFFEKWLAQFPSGKILMPADGEGRNGVYAATQGWEVTSLDISETGKDKAFELAKEHKVEITYQVADLADLTFKPASFDAIGLIYAHFLAADKSKFHTKLNSYLKPGGIIIFEAFSKKHLSYNAKNPAVGGPKDITQLYSKEEILRDFKAYDIITLEEEVTLKEGTFHNGVGAVIRFVGRKQ